MKNEKKNETAYLSNKKDYISFTYKNRTIRFKGPYSLIKIDKIKEWDRGYLVVDAKYNYTDNLVEDYIDLVPILEKLYINADKFLEPIRKVEVHYV